MPSHSSACGPDGHQRGVVAVDPLGDEEAEVERRAPHHVGGVLGTPGPRLAGRVRPAPPAPRCRARAGRGWRRRSRGWPRPGGPRVARAWPRPGRPLGGRPDVVAVGERLHHPRGEERGPAHRARDPADARVGGAGRHGRPQRPRRPRNQRSMRASVGLVARRRGGRLDRAEVAEHPAELRARTRRGRWRRAGRAPRRGRGGGPGAARSSPATVWAGPTRSGVERDQHVAQVRLRGPQVRRRARQTGRHAASSMHVDAQIHHR